MFNIGERVEVSDISQENGNPGSVMEIIMANKDWIWSDRYRVKLDDGSIIIREAGGLCKVIVARNNAWNPEDWEQNPDEDRGRDPDEDGERNPDEDWELIPSSRIINRQINKDEINE